MLPFLQYRKANITADATEGGAREAFCRCVWVLAPYTLRPRSGTNTGDTLQVAPW